MNVLVVGGAGYVGGGIVDKLKENHNVTVFDSLIYEESYRKDVDFVYGDIRDKDKLLSVLNKNDAVIWLAAPSPTRAANHITASFLFKTDNNLFLSLMSPY